jgi:predicted permease
MTRLRRFASAAFRLSLALLPRQFRRRFEREIVWDFEERASAAEAAQGTRGLIRALALALVDVTRRAPLEHWEASRKMSPYRERGSMTIGAWAREVRTSARGLSRRPGFSAAIVGTLALGIGANVAIFTVVDGVLLEPLPFPEADRIVSIRHHAPGLGLPELESSLGLVNIYNRWATTLEATAPTDQEFRNLTGGDQPDRVLVVLVTDAFFRIVRTEPALGRAFNATDVAEGAPPVAILTHRAWTSRFGGDPAVIGRTVHVDGVATEIVGVMPERYTYPDRETALLLPVPIPDDASFGAFGRAAISRLAEGATLADARREVEALQPRIREYDTELPSDFFESAGWGVTVVPLRDWIVGDVKASLWIVLGTAGLLFLIACANVANLFVVRAEARQREVAIRAALGSDRARLAVSFLSESLLLSVLAGAAGTGLAALAVRGLVRFGPRELPRIDEIGIDVSVLLFTAGVTTGAGLAFGSVAVARYLGRSFARVLRDGGRGVTDSRQRHRVRGGLVSAQLALAVVLLVGSGLMVRSFGKLRQVELGVATEGVTAVTVSWGEGERGDEGSAVRFYTGALEALRGVQSLTSVAATNSLPLRPTGLSGSGIAIESQPRRADEIEPLAMWSVVSAGFFETLGMRVLEGRTMSEADTRGSPLYVWVNERLARDFLAGDAVGERVRRGDTGEWWEIAGVVNDVRHFGPREEIQPLLYYPLGPAISDAEVPSMTFVIAHRGAENDAVAAVRDVVGRVGPEVPVTSALSMEQARRDTMAGTSFTMVLLGIAATVALLLGAIGVYAVISYVVSQRTREIGIRVALGAHAQEVQRMVVRQGMRLSLLGVALGILGAIGFTRLMRAILFEISPTDPLTLALVPVALLSVSALACWIPARRAASVDPVKALTAE